MSYQQFSKLVTVNGVKTWTNLIVEKDDSGNLIGDHEITFDKEVSLTPAQLDELYFEISGEHRPNSEDLRLKAYQAESDPLYFKWQRGEATQEEWLSKIAEIKSRYPK